MNSIDEKSNLYIISSISENYVISRNNRPPWNIPEDNARFKKLTKGHTIIMDQNTYEHINRPLDSTYNIIVSKTFKSNLVKCVPTLQDALKLTAENGEHLVFVIGGSIILEEAIPLANVMYLTVIHKKYKGDIYFPDFEDSEWTVTEEEKYSGFSFITLRRVQDESSTE